MKLVLFFYPSKPRIRCFFYVNTIYVLPNKTEDLGQYSQSVQLLSNLATFWQTKKLHSEIHHATFGEILATNV